MRLTIRALGLELLDIELTDSNEPESEPHAIGFQVEMSEDRMLDTSDRRQ